LTDLEVVATSRDSLLAKLG